MVLTKLYAHAHDAPVQDQPDGFALFFSGTNPKAPQEIAALANRRFIEGLLNNSPVQGLLREITYYKKQCQDIDAYRAHYRYRSSSAPTVYEPQTLSAFYRQYNVSEEIGSIITNDLFVPEHDQQSFRLRPQFASVYGVRAYLHNHPLLKRDRHIIDMLHVIKTRLPFKDITLDVLAEEVIGPLKDKNSRIIVIQLLKGLPVAQYTPEGHKVYDRGLLMDRMTKLQKVLQQRDVSFDFSVKMLSGVGFLARESKQEYLEKMHSAEETLKAALNVYLPARAIASVKDKLITAVYQYRHEGKVPSFFVLDKSNTIQGPESLQLLVPMVAGGQALVSDQEMMAFSVPQAMKDKYRAIIKDFVAEPIVTLKRLFQIQPLRTELIRFMHTSINLGVFGAPKSKRTRLQVIEAIERECTNDKRLNTLVSFTHLPFSEFTREEENMVYGLASMALMIYFPLLYKKMIRQRAQELLDEDPAAIFVEVNGQKIRRIEGRPDFSQQAYR